MTDSPNREENTARLGPGAADPAAEGTASWNEAAAGLGLHASALAAGVHAIASALTDGRADSPALSQTAVGWFGTLPDLPDDAPPVPQTVLARILDWLRADPAARVADLLVAASGLIGAPPGESEHEHASPEVPTLMSPAVQTAVLHSVSQSRSRSQSQSPSSGAEPPVRPVPELFADQARRHPRRIAVEAADGTATFAAVDAAATAWARRLAAAGVGPEDVVAVLLPRDRTLIEAMVGIWRAGAAFLLLDPRDPDDLIRYKLQAAQARRLIVADIGAGARWPLPVMAARESEASTAGGTGADPRPAATAPEQLAYVVFTSGSTGRPKGVLIEHGGLAEHTATQLAPHYLAVASPDGPLRVGGAAPVTFDSFIDQVLPILALGHTLVLFDDERRADPESFIGAGLDVVDCAPSQLAVLLAQGLLDQPQPPRLIVFGGEKPNRGTWDRLRAGTARAVSVYGATEVTIGSTAADVHEHAEVNLGFPDGSARVYVLDEAGRVLPPGLIGEIHLGGPGVGRGYLDPERTAETAFVPDPFAGVPGARMYRTGDLGRVEGDGRLVFHGRLDDQLKIRGYRVEPGEIEAALEAVPGVRQAAVVPAPAQGPPSHLVACLVCAEDAPSWPEIRARISGRLPAHLLPNRAEFLDRLPLTANGKIDRAALRSAVGDNRGAAAEPEPPADDLEAAIHAVWCEVLELDGLGVTDDFLDAGGTSLAAMEIVGRLRRTLDRQVPARLALNARTVRELAGLLRGLTVTEAAAVRP
ncbi:amino acid adenylation domain-containing protein [Catenulispora sp. GP43]|uniref:non-ribosomal peptide synthetase n=1 Tax=Catenulispora sp. GP43 TaxID=3156263 RepID=UPI003517FBE4